MHQLIVAQLFERHREKLHLQWICGSLEAAIAVPDNVSPADIVGHLNLIHGDRIQVDVYKRQG